MLDDCSPSSEESEFGAGFPALARAALRFQARGARFVVAVSPPLAGMLAAEGVPRQKIVCVPNGIDVDAFTRAVVRQGAEQAHPDRCVVAFVGSFQPWHRVDLLIEAVAALRDVCAIHVLLVGDGPGLKPALEAAALYQLQERVMTTGAVAPGAMPALLSACDVGVLPHSNPYGDPMKLRDYAAAGLPAVAPDLEPVRQVIEHEVTGLLFSPGNAAALASALARLAADVAERRRLGERARQRVFATGLWSDRARALLTPVTDQGGDACLLSKSPFGSPSAP